MTPLCFVKLIVSHLFLRLNLKIEIVLGFSSIFDLSLWKVITTVELRVRYYQCIVVFMERLR